MNNKMLYNILKKYIIYTDYYKQKKYDLIHDATND